MLLSIIIVNYKSSIEIEKCLNSIITHEKNFRNYEFIIIDNDSADEGFVELKKNFPFIKLIHAQKNGGFAYGNNIGIKVAKGDYILLLNPDTWIEDQSILKMIMRLQNDNDLDIVGPKLLFPDGSNQSFYLPKTYLTLWRLFCEQFYLHRFFYRSKIFNGYCRTFMDYENECFVEQVSGAALMMKRDVINKIGLLDEGYFMYYEESDFCLKAVKAGLKLLYYPESEIIHSGGFTKNVNSKFLTLCYLNSFKRYFRNNFSIASSVFAIFILLLGTFLRVISFRITNKENNSFYITLLKIIIQRERV